MGLCKIRVKKINYSVINSGMGTMLLDVLFWNDCLFQNKVECHNNYRDNYEDKIFFIF